MTRILLAARETLAALTGRVDALGLWKDYVPALSGVTVGNGVLQGRYYQTGKTVHFAVDLAAGSTTALTGLVSIGFPVPALPWTAIGSGFRLGTGGNGILGWRAAGGAGLYVYDSAGASWGAATPFAAGAFLRVSGTYEAS